MTPRKRNLLRWMYQHPRLVPDWLYFALFTRWTVTKGPDYRAHFVGQRSWVRVTYGQYEQCRKLGVPTSIGVPRDAVVQGRKALFVRPLEVAA